MGFNKFPYSVSSEDFPFDNHVEDVIVDDISVIPLRELLQVVAVLDDEAAAVDDPLQGVWIVAILPTCACIAHLSATVDSDKFSEEHDAFRLKVDEASPEYLH